MDKLIIDDYYEMVVLYRALMLVKFPKEIIVPELLGSPIIANIFDRLTDALMEKEAQRKQPQLMTGQKNPHALDSWRMELTPNVGHWEEIKSLILEVVSSERWKTYTPEFKLKIVVPYLSPYTITDDYLDQLLNEINQAFADKG
jgi:hypothetical protein